MPKLDLKTLIIFIDKHCTIEVFDLHTHGLFYAGVPYLDEIPENVLSKSVFKIFATEVEDLIIIEVQ